MIILSPTLVLENNRVRLEPLQWEHFYQLLPIAIEFTNLLRYSPSEFGDEESLTGYFEKAITERELNQRMPFAIYDKQSDTYAGSTSYMNISTPNDRLEIGSTWISPRHQRTGLNRNMKFLMIDYAFNAWECERVELKTDARNEQSRTAIEAIGGQYEGKLRNHTLMTDGHRRDTVYYSILRSEWPEIAESTFAQVDRNCMAKK